MTLEAQIADINKLVAEQTAEYSKLTQDISAGLTEIDTVAQDMAATHALIKGNHQAINDWQTKTGKVTLKDLNGQSYQVDTLPSLINESQKINPHPQVMTKAQFDALREIRKQQYAGSGFVEWGFGDAAANAINDGMWAYENQLNLGRSGKASGWVGQDKSSTPFPKVVVDGVSHELQSVDYPYGIASTKFPPAPDGTKTYDSSTGKVTQHASAAEAFEGVVTNGDFRNGAEGYSTANGMHIEVSNSICRCIGNGQANNQLGITHTMEEGKEYIVEVVTGDITHPDAAIYISGVKHKLRANTHNRVKFIYDSVYFYPCRFELASDGKYADLRSISIKPATEQVITSRKDLVFLESWHEKIADKDVVYPLGNVQYGASAYEGITLANTLVAQGYSAFGQWDSSTKGYGVKWSTLSDANRIKFLKNPEHNIYYDPEAKAYIQVRYRIRVIEGHGDNWYGPTATQGSGYLDFSPREHIRPQGMRVETASDWRMGYPLFANGTFSTARYPMEHQDVGLYGAVAAQNVKDVNSGHEGLCFATPIALVQRLNQGAYHPAYNPMGCGNFTRPDGWGITRWYNPKFANIEPTSPLECFTLDYGNPNHMAGAPAHGSWKKFGSIAGSDANSGRRDQYKFYDAIYAGQVEDLRLNANKLDINQLRDEAMRKAVAGTLRGKEKLPFTRTYTFVKSGGFFNNTGYWLGENGSAHLNTENLIAKFGKRPSPAPVASALTGSYHCGAGYIYRHDTQQLLPIINKYSPDDLLYIRTEQDVPNGTLLTMIWSYDTQLEMPSAEFDSLPWVDIIGYPERIASTFPDGVIGQWIPQLPNGGSQDFKLNRKASQPLTWAMSLDDGSSWNSGSLAINSTKNAYVSPAEAARVQLIYYCADAGFTTPAVNSPVLGTVGDVWLGNDARSNFGARLQQSLTASIATTVAYTSNTYVPLNAKNLLDDKLIKDEFPQHLVPPALGGEKGAYACKVLPTITNYRGLLYMQLHGAQLQLDNIEPTLVLGSDKVNLVDDKAYIKIATSHMQGVYQKVRNFGSSSYDSYLQAGDLVADQHGNMVSVATGLVYYRKVTTTNWGDDQSIPIIDNENVKTDLNGNTVKVFCHHTLLPLGIASH
ncbi:MULTISPECIES: hypothetical protein [Pseudoalteromonas]|uniref:Uncharacterized protein n=1 Tax=Pseudoalteromonas amylolytica TaxID=1859457 RepID=A0A1S1MVY7_9GAMM|nr:MULTISPECIES: hypothetical protein [Pseudoalteromonas]OHU87827.1 hypothetical protein BFC16_10460 [Pseudoalteromonas sp. JW3]OHU91267.1 hypothetical protein BET10_10580 [Pseudoalteromonas amylolytica]